jgi:hypothetical protein
MPELKDAPPQRTLEEIEENYLNSEVECLSEDTAREFAFADRMLRKIIAENRSPNFTEKTFFRSKFGWDEFQVNRERRRMHDVMRLQAIAGRKADREDLEKEKETAVAIAEKEVPRLDAEIAKLTAKKTQLEKAASNATRRSNEVQDALQQLRSPQIQRGDILEKYNARVKHFGASVLLRINELRIELQHRQICLNKPEDMSFEHWIQAIQRLDYACVRRNVTGQYASYELVEPAWGLKKLELMDEVEAMQNEIEALEKEKREFDESQRLVAEFYILENA